MEKNILKTLNLTNSEYNLYNILLRNPNTTASEIIKKIQYHRITVYDILNRLIAKGLANYIIKNKKKYYFAENPNKFLEIIKEKKQELENEEKTIKLIVQELLKIKNESINTDIAKIYEGKEGLKIIMQDIIDTNKTIYVMGGEILFEEIIPLYTKIWAKKREEKKIYAKILTTQKKLNKWNLNIYKKIKKEYNLPTPFLIYGDKLVIIHFENPLTIILLNNNLIVNTYKNHFKMIWDISK